MKKYLILFGATLAILAGIWYWGTTGRTVAQAEAIILHAQKAQSVVNCVGRVEDAHKREVYTDLPVMAKNISVSAGDRVTKDSVLFEVDKNATVQALISSYSNGIGSGSVQSVLSILQSGELSEYLQKYGISSMEDATSMLSEIPDKITSPISGIVKEVNIKGGKLSNLSQPVVVIAEADRLQVRLSVNESQISDIQVGQQAVVTGSGFKNSSYTGIVKSISSYATQEYSGTASETIVEVLLEMNDYGSDFKSGFTANAKIIVEEKDNVVIVPYEAVRSDDTAEEYVYVAREGVAKKVAIKTGDELEDGFEVLSGLTDGDIILMTPDKLYEGQKLTPVFPEEEREGEGK